MSRVLGATDPRYFVSARRGVSAGGLHAQFAPAGAVISAGDTTWALSAPAVGPIIHDNRVTYIHGGIREWFASGPLGVEEGFTLMRPNASRTVTLAVGRLPAGLELRLSSGAHDATLVRGGRPVLRYSGLAARDGSGRALSAAIVRAAGHGLAIRVDVRGARYPVTVDPLVQSAKLSSGESGEGLGSGALAISGDTIVAGASEHTNGTPAGRRDGAAYVFTEPAGGWADMATFTAQLTDGNTSANSLGKSVAIDGDTIVVGAHGNGYADVFTKPAGGWASTATPTAVLSDSGISGNTGFGTSVAISGGTIAVGDPADGGLAGLVDVFVQPAAAPWATTTQPTETLRDSTMFMGSVVHGSLGTSVAISGATVAAGAPTWTQPVTGATQAGAVVEFTEPPGGWSSSANPPPAVLAPDPTSFSGDPGVGMSVAVDGSTIVGGAPSWQSPAAANPTGAAYLWSEPASGGWVNATQDALLTPTDQTAGAAFGTSVAVSGTSVVVGAPFQPQAAGTKTDAGAVYLYREPTGGWVNLTQTEEMAAGDAATNADLGDAVAISGATVAAAAPTGDGSVYTFGDAPLSVTTGSLPAATAGSAYSAAVGGTGGTPPDTWSATGLPAGLTINAGTGAITGAPTAAGSATPTFTVTDSFGQSASRQLGLTVNPAAATIPTQTVLGDLALPQINGTLRPHHPLTCTPGTWSRPGATFTYAWYAIEPKAPATKVTVKTKAKVFGLKGSTKLINPKLTSKLPPEVSVLVGTGPTYTAPFLDQPEFLYCAVTATVAGPQSAVADSATVTVTPGPPELAGPSLHNPRPAKPHITPGVGVGGTTACTPGDWLGSPTFTYAWVAVTKPDGKVLKHFGTSKTLQVPGEAEDQLLQCKVTAKTKYGVASAWTNSYTVPQSAPQPNGTPQVEISTQSPTSDVTVGAAGGAGVAEVVDLTCGHGSWNRDDLTYSYQWSDDRWSGYVQAGQTLHLDMRAGQLQYDDTLRCQVTATTPHGQSNTVQSGPISVWNGCTEWYADVLQTDDPVDTHIGGPEQWLLAVPEDELFDYDESAGTEVKGLFGFAGGDLAYKGPYANGEERPSRAETDGPNCSDYQRYLRGQGYDVKQGPNPDGDQFWIEDGNPFF
ncbi:MAG TPA: putative Ig domain-containing protein [Solirubrobacteraceae bacterium]|nr:putative Ig domain-containing protein [Solirubrobacteraceae bacterium]